uniref:Uncharacterized protein n=1 Tax=Alexandrium catenella TaxID=2925 RepID=A0A7S1PVC4_ALECA
MAEALHVRLRDADRNVLRAELLWFKFHRLDGQPRYMLGLREFDDTLAVSGRRPPRCRQCGSGAGGEDYGASGEESREDQSREEEEGSGPSRSDSCGAESADLQGLQEAQLAVVVVDCKRRDLLVKGYSSAFRLCLGRLPPGARLADLVEDGEAFADWARLAADADARGEDFPDTRATLNMRRGPVHATCRLLRSPEGELDLRRTQLLLFDVSGDRHSVGSRGSTTSLRGTPALHMSL